MIDKSSYMQTAIELYDNPGCLDIKEFEYDARRPIRVKFALRKWIEDSRPIDVRTVLNHIIIMRNCFGNRSAHMLSMFCEDYLPQLLPFLDYLNFTPAVINFNGKKIVSEYIERDRNIQKIIGS